MSNLNDFLSHRIADEEVMHTAVLRTESDPHARYWAAAHLDDCAAKRRTLKFHKAVGASGEDGAATTWAALNVVLANMAYPWRDHPDYQQEWAARG